MNILGNESCPVFLYSLNALMRRKNRKMGRARIERILDVESDRNPIFRKNCGENCRYFKRRQSSTYELAIPVFCPPRLPLRFSSGALCPRSPPPSRFSLLPFVSTSSLLYTRRIFAHRNRFILVAQLFLPPESFRRNWRDTDDFPCLSRVHSSNSNVDSFHDAITKGAGESFAFPPVFPPIATSLGNSSLTRTNELANSNKEFSHSSSPERYVRGCKPRIHTLSFNVPPRRIHLPLKTWTRRSWTRFSFTKAILKIFFCAQRSLKSSRSFERFPGVAKDRRGIDKNNFPTTRYRTQRQFFKIFDEWIDFDGRAYTISTIYRKIGGCILRRMGAWAWIDLLPLVSHGNVDRETILDQSRTNSRSLPIFRSRSRACNDTTMDWPKARIDRNVAHL